VKNTQRKETMHI